MLVRDEFYPLDVRALLERLGVDYRREAQLLYWPPGQEGVIRYQGVLYFVGDIEV